jgi:hypothetical protein
LPHPPPVKDIDLRYFLEDEEVTAALKATVTEISPLIEGRMLTTTILMDICYLPGGFFS